MDTSDIEYRLYYDDKGEIVYYLAGIYSENDKGPSGTFIVIDVDTYTARSPYVKVVDGKVCNKQMGVVTKLVHGEGLKCAVEDVSIVVYDNYASTEWRLKISEL